MFSTLSFSLVPILNNISTSIAWTIIMPKTGSDSAIFMAKTCVNLYPKVKNAQKVISALIHIQEFNNYISIRLIKRNSALIFLTILKNVNMEIFALLLIVKTRYEHSWYIIINLTKISTCSITKHNSAHSI